MDKYTLNLVTKNLRLMKVQTGQFIILLRRAKNLDSLLSLDLPSETTNENLPLQTHQQIILPYADTTKMVNALSRSVQKGICHKYDLMVHY